MTGHDAHQSSPQSAAIAWENAAKGPHTRTHERYLNGPVSDEPPYDGRPLAEFGEIDVNHAFYNVRDRVSLPKAPVE